MAKGVATLALLVISIGLMLGNYWFTFGLWPVSWPSFVFFAFSHFVVGILFLLLREEK